MHNIREACLVEPIEPWVKKAQPGLVCGQTNRVQVSHDGRKGRRRRTAEQLEIQFDQVNFIPQTSFRQLSRGGHVQ